MAEPLQTVAELIGDQPHVDAAPSRLVIPTCDGWEGPVFEDGIYFGLDEKLYHATNRLSTSGIKEVRASPFDYWYGCSYLNTGHKAREETDAMELGTAFHKRILEGRAAFDALYAPALSRADCPEAVSSSEELAELCEKHGLKPGKNKAATLERLREAGAEVVYWDDVKAEYQAELGAHVTLLSAEQMARIELAAAMIERHPFLKGTFTQGYPEVSIFWTCEKTGVPMKARVDYLRMKAIVDLKTISNPLRMPFDTCVRKAIETRLYYMQAAVYGEGVEAAKAMYRERGMAAVTVHGVPAPEAIECETRGMAEWLDRWAAWPEPPVSLFVFQQSGAAPLARGYVIPPRNVFEIGRQQALEGKRIFREFVETYGCDPWVDQTPIKTFDDEEFASWIGRD